jgi:acyl carrier protein
MTTPQPKDISSRLLSLLTAIAPDIDPATVESGRDFRDQFDFDSMDTLHFATAIAKEFGIEVAEREYVQLAGLDKARELVQAKLDNRRPG